MIESNFFKFRKKKIDIYKGWNKSSIIKIQLNNNDIKTNQDLIKIEKNIIKNEKLIIIKKGKVDIIANKRLYKLDKLDALNLFSSCKDLKIMAKEFSEIYIVSCLTNKNRLGNPFFFNFKRDLKSKNLWGGKCISRIYYGRELNVVMFNLKKGFKFHDYGHKNEQITWLIKGKMQFNAGKKNKLLKVDNGVSIGKNHPHGGVSQGAIGFDAFFPKRNEAKYKN